jgi:hypothetical protein
VTSSSGSFPAANKPNSGLKSHGGRSGRFRS